MNKKNTTANNGQKQRSNECPSIISYSTINMGCSSKTVEGRHKRRKENKNKTECMRKSHKKQKTEK